ncbi:hypothetical protein ABT057_24155, partial [Streptomyces sp. NPDC002588]
MAKRRIAAVLVAIFATLGAVLLGPTPTASAATPCDSAPNWVAGTQYTTGTVVRYTDGLYYIAEHDNPGYDPVISTWYWDPYTCSGGGGGGNACTTAPNWVAGTQYTTGTVVRYTDGLYYIAEHDNPGYD